MAEVQSLRPRVKAAQLLELIRAGMPVLVAEYRGTTVDVVKYNDKQTGKAEVFIKVLHHLEAPGPKGGLEAFPCEERQPRDVDTPEKVRNGLVKGQTVALRLSGFRREKGSAIASVDGLDAVMILE